MYLVYQVSQSTVIVLAKSNSSIPQPIGYCYLGLQFNTGGTFNLATEELRKKSIRAYFGLNRTVDISSLSFKSLTRLYDSLIKPILTYGCVVWLPYLSIFKALAEVSEDSLKKLSQEPMEKAHLQFIKYSLGVHKKASNVGSWGETGRYPLGITILHISTTWH